MQQWIDLDRTPLDQPESAAWRDLVARCQSDLACGGMFDLPGFLRPEAVAQAVAEIDKPLARDAFVHARRHNIYFRKSLPDLPPDHPALTEFETANRTICADQIAQSVIVQLYEWPPLAAFLAAVIGKPALHCMGDPLARVNVMAYGPGQALNWHFDRSEFTTTLLLQAPDQGGVFEYVRNLRSADDPNYAGVADVLTGRHSPAQITLEPGTLNIFQGKNTAHRVTPVAGHRDRIIAVFSYFDRPGVMFTEEERIGFYGRAG